MSSETAGTGTAARMSAGLSGREPAGGLAGLIDVLDRMDGVPSGIRTARRPAASRPAALRSGAVRTVPLRSVRPAPMARPAPAPFVAAPAAHPTARQAAAPGRPTLARRAALWGAGPNGEYLAWRRAAPEDRRPPLLRGLIRRLAMWGAGSQGEYLAWGGSRPVPPARRAPSRDVDPPVVLREMPSTPTIRPAAPSPAAAPLTAAALRPRGPAVPAATRVVPPAPAMAASSPSGPSAPAGPGTAPHPTGWPQQRERRTPPAFPSRSSSRTSTVPEARSPSSPRGAGPTRTRGDPFSCPVRGSPPPARPVPTWSPAPASLPPPSRAPSAPG